ncbi:MAG: VWA domain-containing protein [Acidobacteria bacterium]|nr:VWA domain-containing protein [Acidobacteriota bacterium]
MRLVWTFLSAIILAVSLAAGTDKPDVVFHSDVALVRVDAQVVDRNNRTITGLRQDDFVLLEEGRSQEIRNFARENMPVDIVLLFDVSRSMRSHVERITSAADRALRVLGPEDRVAIMVFDRQSRLRMGFRGDRQAVRSGLDAMLREENFEGGTDITRALLDAAQYIGRDGRRDARRAIVILTDDETERRRDVEAVSRALTSADAVLSALLAPNMTGTAQSYPPQSYPPQTYPDDDDDRNYPAVAGSLGRSAALFWADRAATATPADVARPAGTREAEAAISGPTPSRPVPPRSPAGRAATVCKWTMPTRSRPRSPASASATPCTFTFPPASSQGRNVRWTSSLPRRRAAATPTPKFASAASTWLPMARWWPVINARPRQRQRLPQPTGVAAGAEPTTPATPVP